MDLVAGSFQRLEWIILIFLKLLTSTFTGNPRLYRDSFVSVEHLALGFIQDQRFGKQFLKDFQISKQVLKSAVESIVMKSFSTLEQVRLHAKLCLSGIVRNIVEICLSQFLKVISNLTKTWGLCGRVRFTASSTTYCCYVTRQ